MSCSKPLGFAESTLLRTSQPTLHGLNKEVESAALVSMAIYRVANAVKRR